MAVRWLRVALCGFCLACGFGSANGLAALTAAQRKELAAIRVELLRIRVPVKRDAIDDAQKKTDEAEKRLETLRTEAGLTERDSHLGAVRKLLKTRKDAVAKAKQKQAGGDLAKNGVAGDGTKKRSRGDGNKGRISFVSQVAPILVQHCLGCHGKEKKGGLRLDTFAGMERGGKSGPLLVQGSPEESVLMARLATAGPARMPKDAEPLSEKECLTIAGWIRDGAPFDGRDKNASLDKLERTSGEPMPATNPARGPVTVVRAAGTESVSFIKDVAPFLVERCLRCHGGNNPKSDFSVETFEKLLEGGKSGAVIKPGNLEKSRIWDLVGKQRPFKMPPGDARITRTHWRALRTWILEGATFDGSDARLPLKTLAPSEAEKRMAELARIPPQEMRERRRARSEELWRRAFSNETMNRAESDSFLAFGNVTSERLQETLRLAADALQSAQTTFDDKTMPAFKGGLALFVLKDRASFEEFSRTIENHDPQPSNFGQAVVTSGLEDAYVILQDLADSPTAEMPSARTNLHEQIAAALLMRSDKKLPAWLVLGAARVQGAGGPGTILNQTRWAELYRLAGSLDKPEDILLDSSFSPDAGRNVGAALVAFLMDTYGKEKVTLLIKGLQKGSALADVSSQVYGVEPRFLARTFLAKAAERAATGSR